jgi:hypothetical protein
MRKPFVGTARGWAILAPLVSLAFVGNGKGGKRGDPEHRD